MTWSKIHQTATAPRADIDTLIAPFLPLVTEATRFAAEKKTPMWRKQRVIRMGDSQPAR
jgi:hypothetical protein